MPTTSPPDRRRYAPLTSSPLNPNTYLNTSKIPQQQQQQQQQQNPPSSDRTLRRPPKLSQHNQPSKLPQKYAALANESPTQRLLRQKAAAAWRLSETLRHHHHNRIPLQPQPRHLTQQQHPGGGDGYPPTGPSSPAPFTTTATSTTTTTTFNRVNGDWTADITTAILTIPAPEEPTDSPFSPSSPSSSPSDDDDEADIGLLLVVKNKRGGGTSAGASASASSVAGVPGWGYYYQDAPAASGCGDHGLDAFGAFGTAAPPPGGGGGAAVGSSDAFLFPSPTRPGGGLRPPLPPLLPLHTAVKQRAGRRRVAGGEGLGVVAGGRGGGCGGVTVRRGMVVVALLLGMALVHGLASAFLSARRVPGGGGVAGGRGEASFGELSELSMAG